MDLADYLTQLPYGTLPHYRPGDDRLWTYNEEEGKFVPGPREYFDGGDLWEDEDPSRPLPWVL